MDPHLELEAEWRRRVSLEQRRADKLLAALQQIVIQAEAGLRVGAPHSQPRLEQIHRLAKAATAT